MSSQRRIPVQEAAKQWLKDPESRAEYQVPEGEFALGSALIGARSRAGVDPGAGGQGHGNTQKEFLTPLLR